MDNNLALVTSIVTSLTGKPAAADTSLDAAGVDPFNLATLVSANTRMPNDAIGDDELLDCDTVGQFAHAMTDAGYTVSDREIALNAAADMADDNDIVLQRLQADRHEIVSQQRAERQRSGAAPERVITNEGVDADGIRKNDSGFREALLLPGDSARFNRTAASTPDRLIDGQSLVVRRTIVRGEGRRDEAGAAQAVVAEYEFDGVEGRFDTINFRRERDGGPQIGADRLQAAVSFVANARASSPTKSATGSTPAIRSARRWPIGASTLEHGCR